VDAAWIERMRWWLLGVLVIGMLGTITELLLLEHYEKPLQFVPLILIVAALGTMFRQVRKHDLRSLIVLKWIMVLYVVSGFVGVLAHFQGAAEFQLENDPNMGVWVLFTKILHTQAPPLLAPGMMLQLGLIGLVYVYSDARIRMRKAT